jgi:hypothetical protein
MQDEPVALDRLAKIYLKMREAIQQAQQEYDAKIEELKAQQAVVASAMKDQMLALGTESVKTGNGTIILGKRHRFYTQDWDSFKQFVIDHDALELLERRIHQTNMQQFLDENPGEVPPGLNSETEYQVSVRRPR